MPLRFKHTVARQRLRLVLIGLVSLLWIGCSTEQMRNITGSAPINAYSVIQGFVTGGSVISGSKESSLSRIVFEDGTAVGLGAKSSHSDYLDTKIQNSNNPVIKYPSKPTTDKTVTSSIIDGKELSLDSDGFFGGAPLKISLVTDLGIVLQTRVFDRYTKAGKLRYQFSGEFPNESMRLRVVQEDRILEVAMGSLDKSGQVVDVPELDLVNSVLATRMIEQTKKYKSLSSRNISSFVESLNSIIQLRINENPSKNLLIENINRVGVNNQGKFEIYPTSYDPFMFRSPEQEKNWERYLFYPNMDVSSEKNSSEDEIIEDSLNKLPIRKELVNWVRLVTFSQIGINKEIQLFKQLDFSTQKLFPIYDKTFTLKVYFQDSLPLEFRNSILNDGILRIQNGGHQSKIFLSKLNPRFSDEKELELDINLSDLVKESDNNRVFIFLQHTFPHFRVDRIAQAFFKVGLESS